MKSSELVRASLTYILKNTSRDSGAQNDLPETHRRGDTRLNVHKAPAQIAAIYPGHRFTMFCIVEDSEFVLLPEIIVKTQGDGLGEALQFSPLLQVIEFPPDHSRTQLIPIFVARWAIWIFKTPAAQRGHPMRRP